MHLLFRIERSWSFPARLDVIGEHLGRPAQVKRKTPAALRFVATAVRCSESGTLHLVLKEAAEPYPRSRVYSLAALFHPPKPQKRLASVLCTGRAASSPWAALSLFGTNWRLGSVQRSGRTPMESLRKRRRLDLCSPLNFVEQTGRLPHLWFSHKQETINV